MPRIRRSDARDNRERLLEAARAVFAAEGLAAPMREIARHAGVGPATLYRHFPTKEQLFAEAFAERMRACYAVVEDGLADADPWRGLRTVIERLGELYARDRATTAALVSAYPGALDFTADRERALKSLAELVRRAKEAGELRPETTLDDVVILLMAAGGIQASTPANRAAAVRRYTTIASNGLRARRD
ncbi:MULTISPECIES: TetR/AcrR family transcriptional regulator [unclassified Amycolatopsis]|uniref:TetR/AcrR family transcriptional regulator n=1 Tax=unclassified Amycolatopsis TaxID=2618356 RepID=UPI0028760FFA|nr:TetR/AcrR family transcriptional regulator [Amycolatopsis sp. 505]MDS0146795.1 TetR/AcrR family transcriptional regulator [Amycolatopsis sp. CM201R]